MPNPPTATATGSTPAIKVESLTPHKIAVVILLQQYLKLKNPPAGENDIVPPAHIPSTSARRKFCMLLLKLIQYPDMSYKDFHNMLTTPKYRIDAIHLEAFEKCMNDLNRLGIEHLLDLFDTQNVADKMLAEGSCISQYGIVGLYIRRNVVTLDKMTFPEMKSLYKSISLYYEKGIRALAISFSNKSSNTITKDITDDVSTDKMNNENDETTEIDIDLKKLENQIVLKGRNSHSKWSIKQAELFIAQQCLLLENNELRALSPKEMQSKLTEIIQDNPLYAQAHFLSYMNNLRLRDYFSSLDCLYSTFDRNPAQNCSSSSWYAKGFQYSSLNLAILHASFNHKNEALVSLKECIMLAQECGDKQCLDLANAWYCILNSKSIDPLDKCLPDQNDVSMVELLTLSIQFVVKIAASCGYRPVDLFQILMKSDKINCRDALIEYIGSSMAIKSSLWTLYGKNEMASMCSQLLLKLKNTWMFGDFGNTESVCQVLCSLSLWLSMQGEFNLSAVTLYHAKERFPRDPFAKSWMLCSNYIHVTQSIFKCKWQDAMQACCQLSIFDRNLSILQRSAIYIAKRNVIIATLMLEKFLQSHDLESSTRVRGLILLAYSMINPDGVSAQIIDVLNEASKISKDEYLEYENSIVDMIFAQVLLQNNMPRKALNTIKSCMENILANGGIYDKAKTLFIFVKCLIASEDNLNEKSKRMQECMEIITEIVNYFKKLENHAKVLDVYSYVAGIFNDLEMRSERNKYAYRFKKYHCEFQKTFDFSDLQEFSDRKSEMSNTKRVKEQIFEIISKSETLLL